MFGEKYTYDELNDLLEEGYIIKTTKLSPEFSYDDWQQQYPTGVIPLFYIRRSGILSPVTKITAIPSRGEGKVVFMTKKYASP